MFQIPLQQRGIQQQLLSREPLNKLFPGFPLPASALHVSLHVLGHRFIGDLFGGKNGDISSNFIHSFCGISVSTSAKLNVPAFRRLMNLIASSLGLL